MRRQLDLDFPGDGPGHFRLHLEHIVQASLVTLSPQVRCIADPDELGSDAHTLPHPAHEPMPELSLTSPTAPGVTHHWSTLDDFTTEVANARIWAGFHYRFSTRVGTALGRQVGQYVANTMMQPVSRAAQR